MNYRKVYVDATVKYTRDGKMFPVELIFEDGQRYAVDRVKQACRAAAIKVGGTGIRFTVMIGGRETFVYFDRNGWFVETKAGQ